MKETTESEREEEQTTCLLAPVPNIILRSGLLLAIGVPSDGGSIFQCTRREGDGEGGSSAQPRVLGWIWGRENSRRKSLAPASPHLDLVAHSVRPLLLRRRSRPPPPGGRNRRGLIDLFGAHGSLVPPSRMCSPSIPSATTEDEEGDGRRTGHTLSLSLPSSFLPSIGGGEKSPKART